MNEVEVPYGDKPEETAVLLLAAAEELDLDPWVVRTVGGDVFMVPESVKAKAFPTKAAAKKTAAKKE